MGNRNRNIIIIFIILSIAGFLGGMGISYTKVTLDKIETVEINHDNIGANEELSKRYEKIENIALFGVDTVNIEDSGRADSMMILTINREKKKIKVASLMRDCYVNIDGHGQDKLNHAYAFGGPELAIKTINESFDLNIRDFATVNFDSLPKVIDAIGGIEIDIDSSELKYINDYIKDLNNKNKTNVSTLSSTGMQHLNGTQAMAYCRIRYTEGGDYKRTERHREVLGKIFEKSKTLSSTQYPKLIEELTPMVKTSFDISEITSLAMEGIKMGGELEQDRFPRDSSCEETMINKISYIKFDEVKTKEELHSWIFEE